MYSGNDAYHCESFCSKCGVKLQDGQNFCPNCGKKRELMVLDHSSLPHSQLIEAPFENRSPFIMFYESKYIASVISAALLIMQIIAFACMAPKDDYEGLLFSFATKREGIEGLLIHIRAQMVVVVFVLFACLICGIIYVGKGNLLSANYSKIKKIQYCFTYLAVFFLFMQLWASALVYVKILSVTETEKYITDTYDTVFVLQWVMFLISIPYVLIHRRIYIKYAKKALR